jgi:hypothetical protein
MKSHAQLKPKVICFTCFSLQSAQQSSLADSLGGLIIEYQ